MDASIIQTINAYAIHVINYDAIDWTTNKISEVDRKTRNNA